jgi:hypothetical protein
MLDYKTKIDYSLLVIEPPVKNEENWIMKVVYDNDILSFKTPSISFDKCSLTISFDSKKKPVFFEFIDDVETKIIDYLHEHSEEMFKGKIFSKEKLKEGLVTSWDITDDGVVSLNRKCISDDTVVLSTFGDSIPLEELSKSVICIVKVDTVSFSKNKFDINYTLTHVKSKKIAKQSENFFEQQIDTVKVDDMDFF